jgi:hypothetical protein
MLKLTENTKLEGQICVGDMLPWRKRVWFLSWFRGSS